MGLRCAVPDPLHGPHEGEGQMLPRFGAFMLVFAASRMGFLLYLARIRGAAFALAALPMQVLFFLGCGLAVPLGMLAHWKERRRPAGNRTP